jgi:hypothetical protein
MDDVVDTGDDEVSGEGEGHCDLGREPGEGVGDLLTSGVPYHPHHVAAVGFESGADIPAVTAVGRPRISFGGFFVGEDANAGRGKERLVEIKIALELCPGKQAGGQS